MKLKPTQQRIKSWAYDKHGITLSDIEAEELMDTVAPEIKACKYLIENLFNWKNRMEEVKVDLTVGLATDETLANNPMTKLCRIKLDAKLSVVNKVLASFDYILCRHRLWMKTYNQNEKYNDSKRTNHSADKSA